MVKNKLANREHKLFFSIIVVGIISTTSFTAGLALIIWLGWINFLAFAFAQSIFISLGIAMNIYWCVCLKKKKSIIKPKNLLLNKISMPFNLAISAVSIGLTSFVFVAGGWIDYLIGLSLLFFLISSIMLLISNILFFKAFKAYRLEKKYNDSKSDKFFSDSLLH